MCTLIIQKFVFGIFLGKPAHFLEVNSPDWAPTLNMGYEMSASSNATRSSRYERLLKRTEAADTTEKVIREEQEILHVEQEIQMCNEALTNTFTSSEITTASETSVIEGVYVQTNISENYITSLEEEVLKKNEEIENLRSTLCKCTWTEDSFKDNNKKLKYYTGLPSMEVFSLVLGQISDALSKLFTLKLSNFQKLLLTLMKLRHNTSFTGLGYRFNITGNTARRIFERVIIYLEYSFRYFIHWPDRECLTASMPACFKKRFGNKVTVIIDCFEIGTEKPSSIRGKALTFSHYKNRNTVKYLIGITPQGYISFISDGWGGRTSDKEITDKCGILENLLPGDVVLADRGFTVHELVSLHHAFLKVPDFTRGKKKLHPKEVENTREIATVRIHVERVIGTIRNKCKILNGPIPISLLNVEYCNKSFFDYVVKVCCIIVNLCDNVVPL